MTKNADLAVVVRLACETEDRSDAEQSALLRVAARVDREHNKRTVTNPLWGPDGPTGPLSDLVALAMGTRVLEDEQKVVPPPKGHKFASGYLDDWERDQARCAADGCGRGFTAEEWEDRHWMGALEVHSGCCEECRGGDGG